MRVISEDFLDQVEQFVNEYCSEYGAAPSVAKVAEFGNTNKARAFTYLNRLVETGRLTKTDDNTYVSNALGASGDSVQAVLLGSVSCGSLEEAIEHADGYMRLPRALVGKGNFFLLKAHGTSMINAGINNGDLVVIRQQETAEPGDIVVALVGTEVTLKRLAFDKALNQYYLHPENKSLKDIYVDELAVQGVAVKVIKDLI